MKYSWASASSDTLDAQVPLLLGRHAFVLALLRCSQRPPLLLEIIGNVAHNAALADELGSEEGNTTDDAKTDGRDHNTCRLVQEARLLCLCLRLRLFILWFDGNSVFASRDVCNRICVCDLWQQHKTRDETGGRGDCLPARRSTVLIDRKTSKLVILVVFYNSKGICIALKVHHRKLRFRNALFIKLHSENRPGSQLIRKSHHRLSHLECTWLKSS